MTALFLATSLLLAQLVDSPVRDASSDGLTIRVINLVPDRGEVLIAVFATPEAFEARSPVLHSLVLPVDAAAEVAWCIKDLTAGSYAAVAYQDLNDNRTLDKGRFGIPKEPYGFSNGAKASFGPPPFAKARFPYDGTHAVVEIQLKRR